MSTREKSESTENELLLEKIRVLEDTVVRLGGEKQAK